MDLLVTICCNCINSEDFVDDTEFTINAEVKDGFSRNSVRIICIVVVSCVWDLILVFHFTDVFVSIMLEIIVCVVSLTSDSLTEDSEVKIPALTEVWILQSRVIFGKLTLGIEIFCCGILGILILGNVTFGIFGKDFVKFFGKQFLLLA